jgi:hypothetical protein
MKRVSPPRRGKYLVHLLLTNLILRSIFVKRSEWHTWRTDFRNRKLQLPTAAALRVWTSADALVPFALRTKHFIDYWQRHKGRNGQGKGGAGPTG